MDIEIVHKIFEKHFGKKLHEYSIKKIKQIIDEHQSKVFYVSPFNIVEKAMNTIITSSNIRYGDFIEEIIVTFLTKNGFETKESKDKYKYYDLIFTKNKTKYIGEIKIRDNHDSTKKSGQIDNLINEKSYKEKKKGEFKIFSILFFVDGKTRKNFNYYKKEFEKAVKDKKIDEYKIFYGDELFSYFGLNDKWQELKKEVIKHNKKIADEREIFISIKKYIKNETKNEKILAVVNSFLN